MCVGEFVDRFFFFKQACWVQSLAGTDPDFGWGFRYRTKVGIEFKLDLESGVYWSG